MHAKSLKLRPQVAGILQVPCDRRAELLIKGGLDPKKDLLNLNLKFEVISDSSL